MSEKFTRGPWFVRDFGPTKDGDPYFFVQAGGPNTGDGFVDDEYFSLSGIMTRETATLISAAPDLYAALNKTCSNALDLGYCHMADCDACPNMAALRKARGES